MAKIIKHMRIVFIKLFNVSDDETDHQVTIVLLVCKKREFDSEESVQRGLYVPPLSVNFLSIKTIKKL